jgi:hypothetical protein
MSGLKFGYPQKNTFTRAHNARDRTRMRDRAQKTRKNKLKTWEIASDTDRSVDNFVSKQKTNRPPIGGRY